MGDVLRKKDHIFKFDKDVDHKPVLGLFLKKDMIADDAPEE